MSQDFTIETTSRKIRKPLMEKRRRARINDSLETLKRVLLKNTIQSNYPVRIAKLEKADILEMTVQYIQMLHKRLGANGVHLDNIVPSMIHENSDNDKENVQSVDNITIKSEFNNQIKNESEFLGKNVRISFRKVENNLNNLRTHWRPW